MKICVRCNINEAYLKDKYPSYCSDCKNEVARIRYSKLAEIDRKLLNAVRNYNISKQDARKLLLKRSCSICSVKLPKLKDRHIDHCHITGHVRGVLCRKCNSGIAFLRDNKIILSNAIKYLNQ